MSEDHSADRAKLLAQVPADGTAVGNTALIRQLGWGQNRYWYAGTPCWRPTHCRR